MNALGAGKELGSLRIIWLATLISLNNEWIAAQIRWKSWTLCLAFKWSWMCDNSIDGCCKAICFTRHPKTAQTLYRFRLRNLTWGLCDTALRTHAYQWWRVAENRIRAPIVYFTLFWLYIPSCCDQRKKASWNRLRKIGMCVNINSTCTTACRRHFSGNGMCASVCK